MTKLAFTPRIAQKFLAVAILALAAIATTSCSSNSSSSNSANINGTWKASLTDTGNNPIYNFSTDFSSQSGGAVTVTNFSLTSTGNSCFAGTTTQTGSFGLAGNFNGNVTGTFSMTISDTTTGNTDVLNLQGAVNGNTITGTWNVTGSTSCTGSGTFTINKS